MNTMQVEITAPPIPVMCLEWQCRTQVAKPELLACNADAFKQLLSLLGPTDTVRVSGPGWQAVFLPSVQGHDPEFALGRFTGWQVINCQET